MNHWAVLTGEVKPVADKAPPSYRHVLVDDIDPATKKPSGRPGPKTTRRRQAPHAEFTQVAARVRFTYQPAETLALDLPFGQFQAAVFLPAFEPRAVEIKK